MFFSGTILFFKFPPFSSFGRIFLWGGYLEGTQFEILKLCFRNLNLLHVMMELWNNLGHVHRYIGISYPSWKPTKAWMRWVLYHLGIQIFDLTVCSFEMFTTPFDLQVGWHPSLDVFIPRWYCTWDLLAKKHPENNDYFGITHIRKLPYHI